MLSSLKMLYSSSYNKQHRFAALKRFVTWKMIRAFKLKTYNHLFWGDRAINVQYNSFHSMWLMYNSWVDWEEFNLIKNYVKAGDVVLDIGANMGYYSLWMSRFTGVNGKVYAFEPDETNYARLENNIDINQLSDYILSEKIAVGAENGVVSFTTGFDGENHIAANKEDNTFSVLVIKLDTYLENKAIDHIAYLKIDVEGFELAVLHGCSEMLKKKRIDIIQLEINSTLKNSGATAIEIVDFLKSHSYNLCKYNVEKNCLFPFDYESEEENYFAIADINCVNNKLEGAASKR